jgi:hypothetical protein
MKRFTVQGDGDLPAHCDSADQAVQHFLSALHHGRGGKWSVHVHLPRFPEFPTRVRGANELYVSICGRFALRKRVQQQVTLWDVLGYADARWQSLCQAPSRESCESALKDQLLPPGSTPPARS